MKVKRKDRDVAVRYLATKLNDHRFPEPHLHEDAERNFYSDTDLDQFIEQYLGSEQKARLKSSIRQARKRALDGCVREPTKTIVISAQAWICISHLAKSEGSTLSQYLINAHYEQYKKLIII